jgi:hypothetical protein
MATVAVKSLQRLGGQISSSMLHLIYCKSSFPTGNKLKIFSNLKLAALK